jgi:hypothetical protein
LFGEADQDESGSAIGSSYSALRVLDIRRTYEFFHYFLTEVRVERLTNANSTLGDFQREKLMGRKKTQEEFIKEVRDIWGDEYTV